MSRLKQLELELKRAGRPERAKISQRFFKTGKGQYGEGDIFLGITVPVQRLIAKKYRDLKLNEIGKLLKSDVHEHRFTALTVLVDKFERGDDNLKKQIASFYLKNAKRINNWDLVDTSAEYILGPAFLNGSKEIIYKLSKSRNLWEKRIAILTTFHFIRNGEFRHTIKLAEQMIGDSHDLIQKALGWMLREIGNREQKVLEAFLKKFHKKMPRTMLRYSIEKLSKPKQKFYMAN